MSFTNIITEKMVFGGDCIAKIDGKTVFISNAIPNEHLKVEITEENKDFSKANIIDILTPSPYRVLPFCPLYGRCGGCNMQHIQYAHQRTLKADILYNAFIRAGIKEIPDIQIIYDSEREYRARFQFHNGGLMQKKSSDIIMLDNCPCATPEINKWLSNIPFDERPKGRVHVFACDKITSIPEGYDKIIVAQESSPLSKNIKHKNSHNKKHPKRYEGTVNIEENICSINLLGKNVSFSVQGFFQSNIKMLEKTIPLITGGLSGQHALDMYAGCGTFSVFLAQLFKSVTLVEHNKSALVQAEMNLQGTKHESYGLSGAVWVKYHAKSCIENNGEFDVAIIDPPRSGMEKEVSKWLALSNIKEIRSLSCDIATHSRDIAELIKGGYKLEKLYLLDFYPQTSHIESLAILKK